MWQVPPEIYFDLDNLSSANGDYLRVPKERSVRSPCLLCYEHPLPVRDEMYELKSLDRAAVRPASLEICLAVNPVIKGAREMEIGSD